MTLRQQVFNAPGTWTWPGNVSYVDVFVVGGGGGAALRTEPYPGPSGGPVTARYAGGGGGIRFVVGVPVSAPVPVTVGAGGAAQPSAPLAANPGGDSSFGPVVVGGGGGANLNAPPNGGGGGGKNARSGLGGLGGAYGGNTISGEGGAGGLNSVSISGLSIPAQLDTFNQVDGMFEIGSQFEGYGQGGSRGTLTVGPFYGHITANMGCGGSMNSTVTALPGTSGVVIVRWFE